MKKKQRVFELKFLNSKVRKTLPYQLLVLSLIVLVVLILIWIVLFVLGKVDYLPKESGEELGGSLGTLKWDVDGDYVLVDVLDHNISDNNLSVKVNINWSSGNFMVSMILIDFEGISGGCNYTQVNDLVFGENKTYLVLGGLPDCSESDFSNVTGISVYAEVDIPLTQTDLIENIMVYNDDLTNVVDLDNYFHCLENINFSVVGDSEDNTGIEINNVTNRISFNPRVDWYGTYVFNLSAFCDGDVLNVGSDGTNMSFKIIAVDDDAPVPNKDPKFNRTYCDDFLWKMDTNFKIELEKCFYDDDNDDMNFRYTNVSGHNDNLSISRKGDNLTLIPDDGWYGVGYFYVYADDSIEETRGKVDFRVYKPSTSIDNDTTSEDTDDEFEIKTPNPGGRVVTIFQGVNRTFSIRNTDYYTIRWFLDGELVASDVLSYKIDGDLDIDDYVVRVVVTNSDGDSVEKTWNLIVEADSSEIEGIFETGEVVFYTIISVIILIIILIIWLFIVEKNSKKNKLNYFGFGVSRPKSSVRVRGSETNLFRGEGPNRFNLPS